MFKRRVTERGVFAFACQCIVSLRGRTGNRTVTQMQHPFLVEGRPKCARQSLASTLSAPRIAATPYCDPGRHANVITPCLLTPCLNVPYPHPWKGPTMRKNDKNSRESSKLTCFGGVGLEGWKGDTRKGDREKLPENQEKG